MLYLLGYGFFMGIFLATFQLSAETLLITRLGEGYISLGIFAAGALGVISTAIYAFLQHRFKYSFFSVLNVLVIFAISTIFYLLFRFGPEKYTEELAFAQFAMLGPTVAIFLLSFWGIFGRLFDLRQSKRIIGGIDTGQLTAAILTFFTIGLGIQSIPQTYDLLLISSFSVIGTMTFLILIINKFKLGDITAGEEEQENMRVRDMVQNRYILLLGAFVAISIFAYLLIENTYLTVLSEQYPASEEQSLTTFLGWFNGSILVLSFIFQTFFNDRIIAQYGLRVSLTILPVILAVATLVVLSIGSIFGYTSESAQFQYFFIFIAISKLFVTFLRDALENPAFKLYFMTLPNKIRFDVQTKVEGFVVELAKTIAGGVIITLGTLAFFELIHYSVVVLMVIAVWIIVAGKLYTEYRKRIRIKLESQDISMDEMDVVQEAVVEVVRKNLLNSKPSTSIFAFRLLEKINPNFVAPSINVMMRHENPEVREFAQAKMNSIRGVSVSDKYIISASDKEEEKGRKLVSSTELNNLLYSGEISKRRVAQLCKSEDSQDRQYGAELVGNMASEDSLSYLIDLLQDSNSKVRMAAIRSAEKRYNNEILNALIDNLGNPIYSNLVTSALVLIGKPALGVLDNAFYRSGQESQIMQKVVQIMGRIGGPEAQRLLWNKIDFPDKIISSQVLHALAETGFKADLNQMTRIKYAIESDMADIAWNLSAFLEIPDNKYVKELRNATREENEHDIKHIYTLLAMLYDPKSIQLVKQNLESKTNEGVTYAIELLDVLLAEDLKQKIIPILDDVTVSEKVKRLEAFYPRPRLDSNLVLKFLINRDFTQSNRWTKACTLNQIGRLKLQDFKYDLIANLFNGDLMIQEMAAWALHYINPDDYKEHVTRLGTDAREHLDELILNREGEEQSKRLIYRKVRFLQQMDIFNGVSGLILSYAADDLFFQKVEEGDSFVLGGTDIEYFVIVRSGKLNYYRGEEMIRTLAPKDFIGEEAVEEAERTTSILVALEDVDLMLISKDRYYELLSDNILFAQSVMRHMSAS